jgi:hypothetical protein
MECFGAAKTIRVAGELATVSVKHHGRALKAKRITVTICHLIAGAIVIDEDGSSEMSEDRSYEAHDAFGLLRSYIAHRAYLAEAVGLVRTELDRRVVVHDLSKLKEDEFAGFARINAAARVHKFGTPEYQEGMDRERDVIDLHFSRNSHHPERPRLLGEAAERERGLPDDATYWAAHGAAQMSFLDVIEMVCDWWAARKGYNDPRPWLESVELNFTAKGKLLSAEQLWLARDVAAFLDAAI